MTVGERIKKIRQDNAISQTDLANACKISKQTLYKYENNIITNIPSDKIELIADYLSVSPALIMGWEDKEQAVPLPQTNVFMRPVYDSISAGFGVIAQDVPVDYMPTYITCPSEQDKYIWINVHGDSMSPLIDDGSKILIKKQTSVDSGQIAAVLVDDEEAVVAYTHTSVAILDALKAVNLPAVEVHISDVSQREDFRQVSYAGMACVQTYMGLGLEGYRKAILFLKDYLQHR